MPRISYLCLPLSEWERLKQQAATYECTDDAQFEKQKAQREQLIQKSQEWVKTWPNSVQAQVANYEAKKTEKRQRDLETVKAHRKKEKMRLRGNVEAIRHAKQMIFNDTSYGKELLGALHYSKVREEREKQIEFQKYIKEEAAKHEKARDDDIANMADNIYDFNRKDKEREEIIQQIDRNRLEHNKLAYETKKAKMVEEAQEKKLGELEDAKFMKEILEMESNEFDHCKKAKDLEMAQFKLDDEKVREDRRKREELDDALIDVWKQHDDRIRCRIKKVHEETHMEKQNTPLMKKAYEATKSAIEKREAQLNDFIEKGVKKYEEMHLKKEQKEKIAELNRKTKLLELAKEYKEAVKEREDLEEYLRKCICERSTLMADQKDRASCEGQRGKNKRETIKNQIEPCDETTKAGDQSPSFLKESTSLRDALQKRAQEPTPWNALEPSHKYFAEQADAILAECKYKEVARKVVDSYRKTNCVDAQKLPIPNYDKHINVPTLHTCTKYGDALKE